MRNFSSTSKSQQFRKREWAGKEEDVDSAFVDVEDVDKNDNDLDHDEDEDDDVNNNDDDDEDDEIQDDEDSNNGSYLMSEVKKSIKSGETYEFDDYYEDPDDESLNEKNCMPSGDKNEIIE